VVGWLNKLVVVAPVCYKKTAESRYFSCGRLCGGIAGIAATGAKTMEITREEQQLLDQFRRIAPEQRQELLVVARRLATIAPAETPPVQSGQCAFGRPAGKNPVADEPVFTE